MSCLHLSLFLATAAAAVHDIKPAFSYPCNHKNYNFLACDWCKKVLYSTNSLGKLLSDSLLLDSLLLDSLLSDSLISQSHSKMLFKSTNHIQSCNYVCGRARCCFCVFALDLRDVYASLRQYFNAKFPLFS